MAGQGATAAGPPAYVVIGRIGKPHGVRGEVKVHSETDFPERFGPLRRVYLIREPESSSRPQPVEVERVRRQTGGLLLKLAGTDSPEAARALAGVAIAVPWAERVPLERGAFYVGEIVGLTVRTSDGKILGQVSEVIRTAAHDLYRVTGAVADLLIPATRDIIRAVNPAEGEIVVELPEGFWDESRPKKRLRQRA